MTTEPTSPEQTSEHTSDPVPAGPRPREAIIMVADPDPDPDRGQTLPLDLLTTALWLSLWIAIGCASLAVADGIGASPVRRLCIGVSFVGASAMGLWKRTVLCERLRTRPWLVVPLAAAELSIAVADGPIGDPYMAFTMTSIGVAVIVARARIVWSCVFLLDVGYAAAVVLSQSPQSLVHQGALAGVLGQMLGYVFVGLSLLGLAGLFKGFERNTQPIQEALRHGPPALTRSLSWAIARPDRPLLGLPAPRPRLTAAEVRVVEGLSRGQAPKQLAQFWGVSVTTIRSHIKHAKRKTGVRTLRELAALAAHPDWPEPTDREI